MKLEELEIGSLYKLNSVVTGIFYGFQTYEILNPESTSDIPFIRKSPIFLIKGMKLILSLTNPWHLNGEIADIVKIS